MEPKNEPGRADQAPLRISEPIDELPPIEERRLIPPYLYERRPGAETTALFPFFFQRRTQAGYERFILPYYYRREAKRQADVALGLLWSLRGPDRHTFVLPPLYTHRRGKDWGFGLLPLISTGAFAGHRHLVMPPLLTWFDGDADKHRLFVGPYYDVKTEAARWRGLFPLIWNKRDEGESFVVVPPLFFRFAEHEPFAATTVVPPFYYSRSKQDDSSHWGLVPLLFHRRSPELNTTTVPFALFQHARGPKRFRLVTPVLAYADSPERGTTLITPLYQRRRGKSNFDAVAPLFFRTWDVRDTSRGLYFPPLYWYSEDAANRTRVVLPLFVRRYREGISDFWLVPGVGRKKSLDHEEQTWWAAPTFHWNWTDTAWSFNLHPLFYLKRSPERSYLALAPLVFDFHDRKKQTHRTAVPPLYWDFKNYKDQKTSRVLFPIYWDLERKKRQRHHRVGFPIYWDFDYGDRAARYTIAFPFYARSRVAERTRHFVLNTMHERHAGKDGRWQFHLFPLLQLGGGEHDKWWNVLYGLAGYERRRGHRRVRAFWIPFELD